METMSIEEFNEEAEELKDSIMNLYAGDTSYADDMNLIAGICKTIDYLRLAYEDTKRNANFYLEVSEGLRDRLNSLESKEKEET